MNRGGSSVSAVHPILARNRARLPVSMTMRRCVVAFAGALSIASTLASLLVFREHTSAGLSLVALAVALLPALIVALPIILLLHVLNERSLRSFLLGGLVCGAVLSVLNAIVVRREEPVTMTLPMYGVISQSSLVLVVSSMVEAVTCWYLAFGRAKS